MSKCHLLTCLTLLASVCVAAALAADSPAPAAADKAQPAAAAAAAKGKGVADTGKGFVQRIPGTDVTFDMVVIPAGTFKMGSPADEKGRNADEGPQIEVEVDPFFMGKHEVTWAEYNLFLKNYHRLAGQGAPVIPAAKLADAVTYPTPMYELEAGPKLDRMGRGPNFPAVIMSQFAAKQYCKWLSKRTGRFYRLPTEAEWEYACRAGTTTAYNLGNDEEKLKEAGWYIDNSDKEDGDGAYREVGKKKANAWGLYDMHGNVAEWCIDQYEPEWYQKFAGKKVKAADVINWPTKQYSRVIRGGGWESEPQDCRSAKRISSEPGMNVKDPQLPKSPHWLTEGFWIGFRVVSPVKEPSEDVKHKFWDVDDPVTAEVIKRDREIRELVDEQPLTGAAPSGAASAAGASSGK